MRLIAEYDITAKMSASDNYMSEIDVDKRSTKLLIQMIGQQGLDNELLKVMNCLDQNLKNLNTLDYSYEHFGKKLQFSDLDCRAIKFSQ